MAAQAPVAAAASIAAAFFETEVDFPRRWALRLAAGMAREP